MYVYMYVCIYVCMYICMYACIYVCNSCNMGIYISTWQFCIPKNRAWENTLTWCCNCHAIVVHMLQVMSCTYELNAHLHIDQLCVYSAMDYKCSTKCVALMYNPSWAHAPTIKLVWIPNSVYIMYTHFTCLHTQFTLLHAMHWYCTHWRYLWSKHN